MMLMRRIALLGATLLWLLLPASARADVFSVVADHGVSTPALTRAEAAISKQVRTEVRHYWHVGRVVWRAIGGTPINIEPLAQVQADCGDSHADGCHGWIWNPTVSAWEEEIWTVDAGSALPGNPWEEVLDHEVLETEVGLEICDPVEDESFYRVRGFPTVLLADWVKPNGKAFDSAMTNVTQHRHGRFVVGWG